MNPLRQAGLVLAALAMFSLAGGHWVALQTVAWAGMFADYARTGSSWADAVAQTFDGQHPCALCRRIAAVKTQERRPGPSSPAAPDGLGAKVKAAGQALPPGGCPLTPRVAEPAPPWLAAVAAFPGARPERPPVPPPRAA